MSLESLFSTPSFFAVLAVVAAAALVHGTLGFGFPVISTPVIAMFAGIQTAILVTVIPNIVVNVVSILRGGSWKASLGRHWPVAVYVLVGTVLGTRLLFVVNQDLLKLLLAVMIMISVKQDEITGIDWSWLARHPRKSALAFGLLAGFLSGAVNVTVPPLVIYFMTLGVPPTAMTQILNLCFLVGKSTQAATFAFSGKLGSGVLIASVPLTLVALAFLFAGVAIRNRTRPEVYRTLVKKVLTAMALLLVLQVLKAWLA